MYYILDNGIIINSMGRVVVVGQDNGLRKLLEDGGMPEPITQFDEIFGSQNWNFIDGLLVVKQLGIARILNPKNKDKEIIATIQTNIA